MLQIRTQRPIRQCFKPKIDKIKFKMDNFHELITSKKFIQINLLLNLVKIMLIFYTQNET
jgi:hypothetical protein